MKMGFYTWGNRAPGSKTASHDNLSVSVSSVLWIDVVKSVKCTGQTISQHNIPIILAPIPGATGVPQIMQQSVLLTAMKGQYYLI